MHGRRLTHEDLALLAHASTRAVGEWMRGSTTPAAMSSVLNLMALLPPEDVNAVLKAWRETKMQKTKARGDLANSKSIQ
ncbi:hypothetical protein CJD38_15395 [Stenotrophobium rhamnosiphilum]|uniref:HTH cro/C1-type domain-containing protein n=1 Tax=Stenotrophobium rhamnosiphilum TaxID=2029166 RepID=A0A2T5MCL9_9GAMM|nr:hypothetical protein CJD38_15395 [Stenotrophobium rhamnosiphilum]